MILDIAAVAVAAALRTAAVSSSPASESGRSSPAFVSSSPHHSAPRLRPLARGGRGLSSLGAWPADAAAAPLRTAAAAAAEPRREGVTGMC